MIRNVTFMSLPVSSKSRCSRQGFTLVELLTVIAIIALLSSIVVFAIPSLKSGRDLTQSAYVVAGALEQARTYAMANNTYAWVGFFEEDGSKSSTTPATSGTGRVIISMVASQDGTTYSDNVISAASPSAFGADNTTTSSNKVSLTQIAPLVKLANLHMVAANSETSSGNTPARPAVALAYQVGDPTGQAPNNATGSFALHVGATASNPTSFTYPLQVAGATQAAQYTFSKIIEFNPQGEASKIVENVFTGPGPQNAIEIALQATHGSAVSTYSASTNQNVAAIQVEGLSGQVRVYRP